jgi:hypothetical protein
MPSLRQHLRPAAGSGYCNTGLWLRWHCSLEIMERFWELPRVDVDAYARDWVSEAKDLVRSCHPYLKLVETALPCDQGFMYGGTNTIVSLALYSSGDGAGGSSLSPLDLDESKLFHKELSCVGVDSVKIMIGQPVQLHSNKEASGPQCVVRLALGADMVLRGLDAAQSAGETADLKRVVFSMRELAKSWFARRRGVHCPPPVSAAQGVKLWDLDRALRFGSGAEPVESAAGTAVPLTPFLSALDALEAATPLPDVLMLYDLDVISGACGAVNLTFGKASSVADSNEYLHCFAIKSCPLSYVVHHVVAHHGLGLETASIMEVKQALRCGCAPNKVMFDRCVSVGPINVSVL